MKKHLLVLVLFALPLIFNSCKDDPDDNVDPMDETTICHLTQINDEGYITDIEYNNDFKPTMVIDDEDTTLLYYDNEGKLEYTEAVINGTTYPYATYDYDAGSTVPSRINYTTTEFIVLENTNGNITKIESHIDDGSGNDMVDEVYFITYNGDNLATMMYDIYDETASEFVTILNGTISQVDDKNNGLRNSPIVYMEPADFIHLSGKNNVLEITGTAFGFPLNQSYTYTYDENDYPTSAVVTDGSDPWDVTMTYICE